MTTLAIVLVSLTLATGANADETFRAILSGDQEVPPVETDTSGRARIEINKAQTAGEFTLTVNDGQGVTQAHLHCAAVGVNGPVVVFLAGLHGAGLNVDGKWVSNATFTDASIVNNACGSTVATLVESMRDGDVYVNVHNLAHPTGVVRGQVEPTGSD